MINEYYLGISAFYHNSAAALVCNGQLIAAAEEERFTRVKGDASFPVNAISFCMDFAGIRSNDLSCVVFYEKPAEKFGRLLASAAVNIPRSLIQFEAAMPEWITEKLWIEKRIRKELGLWKKQEVAFIPHHVSHAASAFYPSPFENAAILTVDGVGEWATAAYGVGEGSRIRLMGEMGFPNSLGLLYSAFTFFTGFRINNGEYKMMGLAPYGKPVYVDLIKEKLARICEDGSIVLNQDYFSYAYGVRTINKKFEALFGQPARGSREEITPFHADVAASIQALTEESLLRMARFVRLQTGKTDLVMSGGVALNVTATGMLRRAGIFDRIWVQPAAGDSGSAAGAALYGCFGGGERERRVILPDGMSGAYLGVDLLPEDAADDQALKEAGAVWEVRDEADLQETIARLVADGKVVGMARGRAEFGPRALGHRTILADARRPETLQTLNAKIKFREGFRPFAPAVLSEDAKDYFEIKGESPYMLFTFPVSEKRRLPAVRNESLTKTASLVRSDIPAVTHIDYSARIQTVSRETDPFFYGVLCAFKKLTGCSVMVNTSYNVNEEPIVNTAADAYRTFMRSGIDYAVIGNRLLDKSVQPKRGKGTEK